MGRSRGPLCGPPPLGSGHPDEAAAEDLDDAGARAGDAEGGGEHLLQLVAGPSAVRMGVRLCREVPGEVRRESPGCPSAYRLL